MNVKENLEKAKAEAREKLKELDPNYGNKRDYTKIRFGNSGMVTTWAKNLQVAKQGFIAQFGYPPASMQFDKE